MHKAIKKFLLILVLLTPVEALAVFPNPTGFVNDFAGVITPPTKGTLELVLTAFARQTGNEIAVVTLPSLDGRPVEDVAVDLYKQWGIGKKGKDKGVLFLVAPTERKMRIEVGYGLEGTISDALAGQIMDASVVPYFKSGDMDKGIASGTLTIVKTISDKEGLNFDIESAVSKLEIGEGDAQKKGPLHTIGSIILFLILGYVFIRHPWLFLFFLSSGGGRGFGGGNFGGGFGGFGGGISGGGGASRSW